jgi:hypothetical protein
MFDKKIREAVMHIIGVDLTSQSNCQILTRVLVDNGQDLNGPSVVCSIRQKIIGPDMVAMRGPEADTRAVIEPKPTPFGLFFRNFQSLLTPDTLHPLVVYQSTIPS